MGMLRIEITCEQLDQIRDLVLTSELEYTEIVHRVTGIKRAVLDNRPFITVLNELAKVEKLERL